VQTHTRLVTCRVHPPGVVGVGFCVPEEFEEDGVDSLRVRLRASTSVVIVDGIGYLNIPLVRLN
jgi:hypothetical protein